MGPPLLLICVPVPLRIILGASPGNDFIIGNIAIDFCFIQNAPTIKIYIPITFIKKYNIFSAYIILTGFIMAAMMPPVTSFQGL